MLRRSVPLVIVLCSFAIACTSRSVAPQRPATSAPTEADSGRGGSTEEQEGGEEVHTTAERLDALDAARTAGVFGNASQASVTSAATGWVGERVVNPNVDDWEPAVTTDPNSPFIYILTTRYGQPAPCKAHCPSPYITLVVSSDNGATWGRQRPIWGVKGSNAQYDPTIYVVPDTGEVYAFFLNADRHAGFSTLFIKSNDHGRTWTDPVRPSGQVSWADKPFLTSSASGKNVYVSWNGPTGGDLWVGVSHDYGATWTQTRVNQSKRYYYAYDAKTLPDGTVIFSESSFDYLCAGSGSFNCVSQGRVWHHVVISRNKGATWTDRVVAKVPIGEDCFSNGCGEFYTGQTSAATDANGQLLFAYEGAAVNAGPQRVFVKTSADEGRTWSSPSATRTSIPGSGRPIEPARS